MTNPVLLIALPLITAFLLPVVSRVFMPAARVLGPLMLLLTTALGVAIWSQLDGDPVSIQLGGFQPPLGIVLYVDELALLFALAIHLGTLLLWPMGAAEPVRWGKDGLRVSSF